MMITKLPSAMIASRSIAARRLLHHSSVQQSATAAAAATQPRQWTTSQELHVSANSATVEAEWSQELSFASPESDFTAVRVGDDKKPTKLTKDNLHLHVSANEATVESEWLQELILANAKEDVARLQEALVEPQHQQKEDQYAIDKMLYQLHLQSPETAVGYTHVAETMKDHVRQDFLSLLQEKGLPTTIKEEEKLPLDLTDINRMVQQMHLLSPESALGVTHVAEVLDMDDKVELRSHFVKQGQTVPEALPESHKQVDPLSEELLLQQMLVSSPESATGHVHAAETLTSFQAENLAVAAQPLPDTLEQAKQADEHRAIVVTTAEAPFRVVHVNEAWEGLCGYSLEEAKDQPIGELLRGPQTATTNQMAERVHEHPEHLPQSALLINYTKEGRPFHNHLQVGPLLNDTETVEYLVGVLQEVDNSAVMMRMKA